MTVNKDNINQLWHDWFMTDAFAAEKKVHRFLNLLPHEPRCKFCNAPFEGVGSMLVRTFYGKRQSNLNPNYCSVCEDFAKQFPGGAEVEMSMLFVDVRGSTALSESMSAMEFQKLINRFFVGTTKIIGDEFGLVEKLAGDAVAAFWGAGFAGKDYVARTIRSSQKIQKAMSAQNIPVGVGVHAGVAYFGAMGSEDGLVNISAIGEEVNTAARLASKAATGEIIISEAALAQTDVDAGKLETRTLELKGISEPMTVRVMRG